MEKEQHPRAKRRSPASLFGASERGEDRARSGALSELADSSRSAPDAAAVERGVYVADDRQRDLLWNAALRTAESGHLVFVQMEADSAEEAAEKFAAAVDRPIDDYLLASCWQELDTDEQGRRFARYDWHRRGDE